MSSAHDLHLPNMSTLALTGARAKTDPKKLKIQEAPPEAPSVTILITPPHTPFGHCIDPLNLLEVRKSTIDRAGDGLFAKKHITTWSVFAEYFGPVGTFVRDETSYAVRLTRPGVLLRRSDVTDGTTAPEGVFDTVYGDPQNCLAAKANTRLGGMEFNNAMIVSSLDQSIVAVAKDDNTFLTTDRHAVMLRNNDVVFECERLFLVAISDINAGDEIFNFYNRDADSG